MIAFSVGFLPSSIVRILVRRLLNNHALFEVLMHIYIYSTALSEREDFQYLSS
jgi:hypothetical protein